MHLRYEKNTIGSETQHAVNPNFNHITLVMIEVIRGWFHLKVDYLLFRLGKLGHNKGEIVAYRNSYS